MSGRRDQHPHVGGHTPPATLAKPPTMITISSLIVIVCTNGFTMKRRLGLAEEDIGRRGERLGAPGLHRALHHPRHPLDHVLHDRFR